MGHNEKQKPCHNLLLWYRVRSYTNTQLGPRKTNNIAPLEVGDYYQFGIKMADGGAADEVYVTEDDGMPTTSSFEQVWIESCTFSHTACKFSSLRLKTGLKTYAQNVIQLTSMDSVVSFVF